MNYWKLQSNDDIGMEFYHIHDWYHSISYNYGVLRYDNICYIGNGFTFKCILRFKSFVL